MNYKLLFAMIFNPKRLYDETVNISVFIDLKVNEEEKIESVSFSFN